MAINEFEKCWVDGAFGLPERPPSARRGAEMSLRHSFTVPSKGSVFDVTHHSTSFWYFYLATDEAAVVNNAARKPSLVRPRSAQPRRAKKPPAIEIVAAQSFARFFGFRYTPRVFWKCECRDSRQPGTYAANCLLARRHAERRVRFFQIYRETGMLVPAAARPHG